MELTFADGASFPISHGRFRMAIMAILFRCRIVATL